MSLLFASCFGIVSLCLAFEHNIGQSYDILNTDDLKYSKIIYQML